MKILFPLAAIMVLLYSCSSTNLMTLSATQPAPVSLPASAKSAAIVNRTSVADDSKTIDAIHRTVNLESKALQQAGAAASLTGLTDALIQSNRFDTVKALTLTGLSSYGAGVFPVYLSWDTVANICRESHADLLFSLELFDAGSTIGIGGFNLVALATSTSIQTKVRTGWRIYDPATRTILDQFVNYRDLSSQGGNIVSTGISMLGHKEAVIKAGNEAGADYATRIVPYSIRVSRYYYVRGNESFVTAKRMARAGDWDKAGALWREAAKSPSRKIAGRGCYNMAIISEINGDLNGALEWAKKAYEVYQMRYSLSYVNILQQRLNNNAVLRSQGDVTSGSF